LSFIYHTLFKKGTQKSLLSSSKKTTASLLLLALFSLNALGVCVYARAFFLMRSVFFVFFRDMIRCFITVVPVEKKMRGQSKPKKRKKRKKTPMTKTDKFLFTTTTQNF